MKLKLTTLPFASQSVTYRLGSDFFPGEAPVEVNSADVEVTVTVTRTGDADYTLEIACHGTMGIPCDRCLEPMVHHIDTEYHLNVRQQGDTLDDSRDNVLLVPACWTELDLEPLVRDTVLLTIPVMHTHTPDECNDAMLKLLDEHDASGGNVEAQAGHDTDPRWDALRNIDFDK